MNILQFIYPFICLWYLACFPLLAIVNSAMNMHVQVSESLLSRLLDTYLGVELLGHVVILFNFLSNHQTVFHSGWTTLHYHQQRMRIPTPPSRLLPLLFSLWNALLIDTQVAHFLISRSLTQLSSCHGGLFGSPNLKLQPPNYQSVLSSFRT